MQTILDYDMLGSTGNPLHIFQGKIYDNSFAYTCQYW